MIVTFYAGAADAAGTPTRTVEGDLSMGDLITMLGQDDTRLAAVLERCSVLVDGQTVQDAAHLVSAQSRVDILPPFAGG